MRVSVCVCVLYVFVFVHMSTVCVMIFNSFSTFR